MALGPGHSTQALDKWPLEEGWYELYVQAGGAQAGWGQQVEPLEQAGEQQEHLGPGQVLAHTRTAACQGNRGQGGDQPGL